MSSIKHKKLQEEESDNSKQDKNKDKPIIKYNDKDKKDIIIELSGKKKQKSDDNSMNSAEYSGQNLRDVSQEEKLKPKAKTTREELNLMKYQKKYEKYQERLKDKTMRMELEKFQKETERWKQKFEEESLQLHKFRNNTEYQKMLSVVEKQLILMFFLGIIVTIFNATIYFYLTEGKEGMGMAGFSLGLAQIAIILVLFVFFKLGLLNDPHLSRAFRLFIIFQLLIVLTSFVINIIILIICNEYFETKSGGKSRIIIYILFFLMNALFLYSFKFCFTLFVESLLILLKKKTEYSILILNEQKSESINNNNITSSFTALTEHNNTSNNLLNNENPNNKMSKEEEEQYKNFNYFSTFHYSVTSNRNDNNNYFRNKK